MAASEVAFLTLLACGILALLSGLWLTRLHWREDIPPYGRRTRTFHVMMHPEEYVKDAPLHRIRGLNLVGLLLLAAAVLVLVQTLLHPAPSPNPLGPLAPLSAFH